MSTFDPQSVAIDTAIKNKQKNSKISQLNSQKLQIINTMNPYTETPNNILSQTPYQKINK